MPPKPGKTENPSKPHAGAQVKLQTRRIDNPGGGDCAFYAFAIGLIDIIQDEQAVGKQDMFKRWVELAPALGDMHKQLCSFDMKHQDKELLNQLQRILRTIYYETQLQELKRACVASRIKDRYCHLTATKIYNDFAGLYFGLKENINSEFNLSTDYNLFAGSEELRKLIKKLPKIETEELPEKVLEVHDKNMELIFESKTLKNIRIIENSEQLTLAPLLIRLIYGEGVGIDELTAETPVRTESLIIQCMQRITNDHVWGALESLTYLADVFRVNLCTYRNGESSYLFKPDPNKHTIFINNENNMHWTTRVCIAKSVLPEKEATASSQDASTKRSSVKENASRQTHISSRHEAPKTKSNASKELVALRGQVRTACIGYTNYSQSIWFSFFHRHGATGRRRAARFYSKFIAIDNYDEAKAALLEFLNNNNGNGNMHPHSLRTMILHEVLAPKYKIDLKTTSAIFDYQLKRLNNQFNSEVSKPDEVSSSVICC